ncbi:hypothetical protein HHI36_006405 [Cryptolaemus montrouzieri]|uniref:Nucleoporin Nup159/Nup146 N-terminal domain-containing protein n=1 Tax=Cryptolaemus montrouzieri TaxID=559131 RepID=A0ABD2NY21_9CUCU
MKIASDPVDVQDFQKFQKTACSLIATASRFGLVFVGCNSPKLQVIRFTSIEEYAASDPTADYSRRDITIPSAPHYISVNCDQTKLAVIVEKENCLLVLFYDVQSFLKQNITLLNEVRLSTTPGLKILDAGWHPTIDTIFTECKADGTLGIYELKDKSVDVHRLPAESNASCFCWSPKGKQIAVGSKDGKLTHYKPDLKAVKVINAPPFEKPHSIISLQWISNYQFIGVFKPSDLSDNQCNIVVIDAPKAGNSTFTNFFDVCYSNGNFRPPQFYMIFEQHWNTVLLASSNSMEVGVLACTNDLWNQWSLPDSARAELPLDENREETYPIGIAIDTSSIKSVPWGESSLPPAPSLLILSHKGILCCFKIINLKEGALSINSPPEKIADLSGLGAFTTGNASCPQTAAEIPKLTLQPSQQLLPQQQQSTSQPSQPTQVQISTKPQSSIIITSTGQSAQKLVTQTGQFSFQPQQVTVQTVQKGSFSAVQTQPSSSPVQKGPFPAAQSQPSSTPSVTSLFGGQITITPTYNKQANTATSLIGSMLLSNLNTNTSGPDASSGSTLVTPNSQQQFPSLGQSQTTIKTATTQPKIGIPVSVAQSSNKSQTQTVGVSSVMSDQVDKLETEPQENNAEIEKILKQMLEMECANLEKELKVILLQGKQLKINLDPKDMDEIVHKTKDIDDFMKDLVETSESQSSEIHILNQSLFQSWAWFEEARSRFRESQNEEIRTILKSKPLDSVSEKHLSSLKLMEHYLDSQLSQAHKALDEQWDNFQEYCRKISRVQLPTMEAIFQTMVKQNAILQKQDYILKDICSQIKGKKKLQNEASLINPLNRSKTLEESFQNLKLEPEDIYRIYYQKVLNREKSISPTKSNHLRKILHNREVPHVTVKSQISNSIFPTTPEMKDKSIFVQMTPTTRKPEVARNLNFYQSTPLNIQPEQPSKLQINSSPLSAFVPTNTSLPIVKAQISSSLSQGGFETQNYSKPGSSNLNTFSSTSSVGAPINLTSSSTFGIMSKPQSAILSMKSAQETGLGGQLNFGGVQVGKHISVSSSLPTTSISQSVQNVEFIPSNSSSAHTIVAEKPIATCANVHIKSISAFKINQNTASISTTVSLFNSKPISSVASSIFSNPTSTINISDGSTAFISKTSTGNIQLNSSSSEKAIHLFTSSPIISSSSLIRATTAITAQTSSALSITSSESAPMKSSFFSPIMDAQQSANSNFSSAKPSAFMPVTTQSPITVSKPIFTTSATLGTSSIFGKSVAVSSSIPSSLSSISSSQTSSANNPSTTITGVSTSKGSLFSTASIESSSSSQTFGTSSTILTTTQSSIFSNVASVPSSGSQISNMFGSPTSANIGFSFLTGGQKSSSSPLTSTQSSIFTTTSTTFSPIGGNSEASPKTATITPSISRTSVSTTSSTSTDKSSIFTSSATSISATTGSVFRGAVVTSSTSNSGGGGGVFGGTVVTSTTSISKAGSSIFGGTVVTSSTSNSGGSGSIFGGTVVTSATSNSGTSNSIFGGIVVTSATSSSDGGGGLFGSSNTVIKVPTYGELTSNVGTSASIFSSTPPASTISNSASLFATKSSEGLESKSIFGSATTSSQSSFGNAASFSQFGNSPSFAANTPTTSASIFGSTTTTSSSLFGGVSTSAFGSTSSAKSPFGTTTSTAGFGTAAFGFPVASSAASFGNTPTAPFGSVTTSSTSPFGSTPAFGNTSSNISSPFGETQTSSSSPFGAVNTTTSSIFGKPSIFSQTSSFGSSFSSTPVTSSVFGQAASAGSSIFGSSTNSNMFGGTTTSSAFGSTTTTPFGVTSAAEGNSPFGQTSSSGSLFGSTSVFGGASNSENTGGS